MSFFVVVGRERKTLVLTGQYRLYYLTQVIGYEDAVAKQLIKDRARKDHRSPSRNRD